MEVGGEKGGWGACWALVCNYGSWWREGGWGACWALVCNYGSWWREGGVGCLLGLSL